MTLLLPVSHPHLGTERAPVVASLGPWCASSGLTGAAQRGPAAWRKVHRLPQRHEA